MKRLSLIFAIIAMAFASVGCERVTEEPEKSYLVVPFASTSVAAKGTTIVINIYSNTSWTIDSSVEWVKFDQNSYNGSAGVLCTIEPNESKSSRSTRISVAPDVEGETPSYAILLTQSGTTESGGGNNDGGNDDGDGGDDGGGNDDGGNGDGGDGGSTSNLTPHPGWAELPAEEDNSDYYYAYHMIPDIGSGKVRNFSVCYSADLGCPVWVASPMHSYYTQKNTDRSDAYAPDPDIPSSIQVHKRSGYTRGHLLGSADRLVSVGANHQAFYYSNIAPQLSSGFNTGGGVWNNLEEYCDGQLCADTLYMVNGCYWKNYNTSSSGTVIPTHYYKVLLRTKKGNTGKRVADCSSDELKCVAFLVAHNSDQHQVEPHSGMMMSVAELEELTGHNFFPNVPNAPKESYNRSDWGL